MTPLWMIIACASAAGSIVAVAFAIEPDTKSWRLSPSDLLIVSYFFVMVVLAVGGVVIR